MTQRGREIKYQKAEMFPSRKRQNSSEVKELTTQVWWPEFDPRNPSIRKSKVALWSPLASRHRSACTCAHTYIHLNTSKEFFCFKMSIHLCDICHVCRCWWRREMKISDLLELELQAAIWMLGTKLRSSTTLAGMFLTAEPPLSLAPVKATLKSFPREKVSKHCTSLNTTELNAIKDCPACHGGTYF